MFSELIGDIVGSSLDLMLDRECDILRKTSDQDSRGGRTETASLVESRVLCAVIPLDFDKAENQNRDGQVATHSVYLGSRGYELDTAYVIRVGSKSWDVVLSYDYSKMNTLNRVDVVEVT